MKIAIIGAGGLRTPLIIQSMIIRQNQLHIDELSLMDIHSENLEIIRSLMSPFADQHPFQLTWTTDARKALQQADFVITTFRVGGMEGRVIDERVPLSMGLLGQETTGAGGFAMAMRTIPVLLEYIELMKDLCPNAWLINFANPSGLLTEAIYQISGWKRVVGICDAPPTIQRIAAAILQVPNETVFLDYFGLNHLGWVRGIYHNGINYLPHFLELINQAGGIGELPFDVDLLNWLGMIPNEYLYYYYYSRQAVENILAREETRGEFLLRINHQLIKEFRQLIQQNDFDAMLNRYQEYLTLRGKTYMSKETAKEHNLTQLEPQAAEALSHSGYAGVALDLIEGLTGNIPHVMTLNIPNHGAIPQMRGEDVVEIPALVQHNHIIPLSVGEIPPHCASLMQRVKEYERLTITAARESSRQKAVLALAVHPLINDYTLAQNILAQYQQQHGATFPTLK
ncbi:MAG: glycoside hydrolase [Anaerolineales bacterium]